MKDCLTETCVQKHISSLSKNIKIKIAELLRNMLTLGGSKLFPSMKLLRTYIKKPQRNAFTFLYMKMMSCNPLE